MNELGESDPELNAADYEHSSGEETGENDKSFWDSEEERQIKKKLKVNAVKINNSFTGPYPLDPTDFDHKDKGSNAQFEMMKDDYTVEDII